MIDIAKYELKKFPKPPRKLCRTIVERWLRILSPSLVFVYAEDEDVNQYFLNVARYKLYKRTLDKGGYKQLYRAIKNSELKKRKGENHD